MLKTRFKEDEKVEVGIDEAGRGPLWGPLVAGAVCWPEEDAWTDHHRELVPHIKDSKKLSSTRRDELYRGICEYAIGIGVGHVMPAEIDTWGATRANQVAFGRALEDLCGQVEFPEEGYRVLIDGILPMGMEKEGVEQECIIEGDATYLSIAAASIVAKVVHDNWVVKWCSEHVADAAKYDLLSCKGYGTAKHREGLLKHGYTDLHRRLYLRKLFPDIVIQRYGFVEEK